MSKSWCWLSILLVGCVPADPRSDAHPGTGRDSGPLLRPREGGGPAISLSAQTARPWIPGTEPLAMASKGLVPLERGMLGSGEALPRLSEVYYDFFERSELGPDYFATSPNWRLREGKLCVRSARNHPLWLRRVLPVNARIEFDATSASPEGDIKAEFWGDGASQARGSSYGDATSYLAILGGWKNTKHLLARLDEHAPGQPSILVDPGGRDLKARPVQADHTYHFKVERNDGRTIEWLVDDLELASLTDPAPLKGPGHSHFAFNDWEVPLCFDNLKITPLPGE